MVARPVVVYLDTSDISRFADVGTDYERGTHYERSSIRKAYEFLQRNVEHGNIEIRFSGLHIAEIAKPALREPPLQEPATRKAHVIERLCGSRASVLLRRSGPERFGN